MVSSRSGSPDLGNGTPSERADHDLSDMLQEMRVLQQGAQVLTAFLIILPFSETFRAIAAGDKWVFLATFLVSLASLVFLSAPAASHRLERPLKDADRFKNFANRLIRTGLFFQSLAWMLTTEFVVSTVLGQTVGIVAAAAAGVLIAALWWLVPLLRRRRS
jgi:membrane-bound acyltransferase YfiQ involved in biofilm formation